MNLAQHFCDASLAAPNQVALSWEGGELTYSALSELAQALRRELDPSKPRIGILAQRSLVAYAAVQAVLASGAAYVPLRPGSPVQHNARICALSGIDTLIVGAECTDALDALLAKLEGPIEIIAMEDAHSVAEIVGKHPGSRFRPARIQPGRGLEAPRPPLDGSAYILFTSGSTGLPKGIRVLHSNVESYLRSFLALFPIVPSDRLSQLFDLTFDLSVHDQFVTWASQATLVVFPDKDVFRSLRFALDHGVTVWFSVPAVPALLESLGLAEKAALPGIRLSLFCGEKLSWNALQVWRRVAPDSRMVNLYGPTEATIAISYFEIPGSWKEEDCFQGGIPIGYPFPSQSIEVRRSDGSLCAPREEGGLWLGGDQITPGYLDPEKTADRFIFKNGLVWYHTGDLGFRDESDRIHFVGREDFQVKIMGYRIELGAIEAAILRATGAPFAIADVARLRGEVDEIVCVLPTAFKSRKKLIREAMKDVLEPYMIPKVLIFLDELPLNANGKVDRAALKAVWNATAG